jgi:transcriptional regulator with XRE-family HTH domain
MERADIADLVDHLFKTRLRPDGKEYTSQDVENATDKRLTSSAVRKLREGKSRNPSRDTLMELCFFFRVPAAYFFPELEALAPPAEDVARQDQVHVLLRSIDGLPPDATEHLQGLIEVLRRHGS